MSESDWSCSSSYNANTELAGSESNDAGAGVGTRISTRFGSDSNDSDEAASFSVMSAKRKRKRKDRMIHVKLQRFRKKQLQRQRERLRQESERKRRLEELNNMYAGNITIVWQLFLNTVLSLPCFDNSGLTASIVDVITVYLDSVQKRGQFDTSTIANAIIYLRRFRTKHPKMSVGGIQGYTHLAITALIMAHKMVNDEPYSAHSFSKIMCKSKLILSQCEREFLAYLNYEMHVNEMERTAPIDVAGEMAKREQQLQQQLQQQWQQLQCSCCNSCSCSSSEIE